jgi:hydrogenase large subunit
MSINYPETIDHEVDPIPRIEGHLGVGVVLNGAGTNIESAFTHGNLFRGFENIAVGREPNDPITLMQRICGV